ncbi:SAP domain-containing protein [Mycena indigotica]|uniref:SAP domain-containing protein n=1 Tax=Mycena indigotica TaxID=2126181 RepID=A0A8H6W8F1_9AGAR|nr:SAP domain-containing protein [Mycena indigotica]KAF7309599.1 SAP domain-containing protein [Mycena indigotica]
MPPPTQFSGALAPKKKIELQAIASALNLEAGGTKEELQGRIRKYLDNNQSELEDDPTFAGLFGRRKRSQPPPSRVESRALKTLRESTPIADVSAYLEQNALTPSSLPPLPDSPIAHGDRSIIDQLALSRTDVSNVVQRLKTSEENILRSANSGIIVFRETLSSSRNIWTLTAVLELIYILYMIIPWNVYFLKFGGTTASIPYPPLDTIYRPSFTRTLIHWFIPALLLPALAGSLISFSPALPTATLSRVPFDPLTASIIRLALQFAYDPSTMNSAARDVIGLRIRALNSAIGVAFAFAEAIKGAPAVWQRESPVFMTEETSDIE